MKRARHFGPDRRIPYAASWSSERQDAEVRYEPLVGGLALFQGGRQGEGVPDLGKLHSGRQRECVARLLCQVCHRPLKGKGIMVPDATERHVTGHGKAVLVTEPLVCPPCFLVAKRHCVGMRRMIEDGTFQTALVWRYQMIVQMLDPKHPDYADIPGNDGATPFAGYLRYAPTGWRLVNDREIKDLAP